MIIKIPLSLYRKRAYNTHTDQMEPLRRYWVCNIKYRNAGLFHEIVAHYSVTYL